MKFTAILAVFLAGSMLMLSGMCGLRNLKRLDAKNVEIRREVNCMNFVAESFRNTCRGKGFASLNEWQKACRAMWQLDYIGWANACDFMIVPDDKNQEPLFYGKWILKNSEYEVYCRKGL